MGRCQGGGSADGLRVKEGGREDDEIGGALGMTCGGGGWVPASARTTEGCLHEGRLFAGRTEGRA